MKNNTFNPFKGVIIVASAKRKTIQCQKEASDAVAMAVKAAFTDDKKDQK